ncbi:MAG: hypothetical protein M8364_10915 [Methylobacter sp.]|uniref:hypothetical protein n=1 Tax=Methylobacter sp. TaxID=2051955 RepID=UPI002587CB8B|nr:hypothetical protein [Methylobacter sp.]MCL7421401.1 hypothetical protein [Methylobacter sp.]
MKTIDRASNTVATKPETAFRMNTVEFAPKKFWLPLLFGIALIYMGNPLHAGEYESPGNQPKQSEGTQGQKYKWGKKQRTDQGGGTLERGTTPGSEQMERGTTPGSEQMERGTTPGSEQMERGTTPGSDPMERGTTPGSEQL